MNLLRIGLLALTASLIGCSKPAPPTVILDGWWNVDYAKTSCDYAKRLGFGECAVDPTMELRAFEHKITTEFAADSRCNGIRLAYFSGSDSGGRNKALSDAISGEHWMLMLDYDPDKQEQRWSMDYSGKTSAYFQGAGDARAIAARACDVVLQRGASIAN
jgi:hypothetical protein